MIFLDTGFVFALVSAKDQHHERVREVFESLHGERLADSLLTTNHVVAETLTLARKLGHDKAVRLGERLYAEKVARIHWATPDEEKAAFAYLKKHDDKDYSFVDCLSFVVIEKLGIREAWAGAVDSDFTHHGFIVRPGPAKPRKPGQTGAGR